MNVARPARSLLGRCVAAGPSTRTTPTAIPCLRQFHSSPATRSNRRSRFKNVTAEKMGLLKPEVMKEFTDLEFPDLDESDYAALEKRYGAAHVEAIKAGQKAVDPTDMAIQGRLRDDQYRPEGSEGYVDDYGIVDPKVDLKPEAKIPLSRVSVDIPEPHEILQSFAMRSSESTKKAADDYLHRAMTRALRKVKDSKGADLIDLTHEELDDLERNPDSLEKYLAKDDSAKSAGEPAESDFITRAQAEQLDEAINQEMDNALKSLEGSRGEELSPSMLDIIEDGPAGFARLHSAEAPELGKVPGMAGLYKLNKENSEADDEGIYTDIQRLTGMSLKELKSLFNKVLVTRFVHNQTRLGKIRSLSVLAICGNGNGRLGIAMAKSTEAEVATQTAKLLAIRNMKPIRRYENRTVFGNVKAKVSGTIVELSARPPGFGLRVPYRIFEMCRAAGIHDLAANMPRSKNPMNSVKATYQALLNQPDPEEIAIGRGKKLVDVRKVYYGGSVH